MNDNTHKVQQKCTNCGGVEFDDGWVHVWGNSSLLRYSPFQRHSFSMVFGERVTTKRCLNCNQLTFFCGARPQWRFSVRDLLFVMTLIAAVLGAIMFVLRS